MLKMRPANPVAIYMDRDFVYTPKSGMHEQSKSVTDVNAVTTATQSGATIAQTSGVMQNPTWMVMLGMAVLSFGTMFVFENRKRN